MKRRLGLGLVTIMLGGLGCGWNYTPTDNVLPPTADDDSDSEGPAERPALGSGESDESGEPCANDSQSTDLSASYRIDCMDIQRLGDADHTVFQVATLQSVWTNDIAKFKLNVLLDVLSLDEAAGTGTIAIRSGVGTGWDDQCAHAETVSAEFPVVYESMVTQWAPSGGEDSCAAPAKDGGAGTYTLELGAEDRVYIYAQDTDGTAFNCSLEPAAPDAIPITGLSATLSSTADGSAIAGSLTGCMAEADAKSICACLSVCAGNQHPDCPGCPGGALPLGVLLGGIFTTPYCTQLLGEPAFDVEIEFSARRLANVPGICG
jgi:hypothetical protein